MTFVEQAVVFRCGVDNLIGIVTIPAQPKKTALLIVVGGPQYRAGSHRQFVLLARILAAAGYASLRFDFRGMGDSTGTSPGFEHSQPDIAAATEALMQAVPSLARVVLWGLCDAASAALLYWHATHDLRVNGMVLLNPWVRSDETLARARVRHYYGQRLFAAEFWRKLLRGGIDIRRTFRELSASVAQTLRAKKSPPLELAQPPFTQLMPQAFKAFPGQLLVLLSGEDLTAHEFQDCVAQDPAWAGALSSPNVAQVLVPLADHTFSRAEWRSMVEVNTLAFLDRLDQAT